LPRSPSKVIDDRDLATADRDHQRPLVTNRYKYATAAGRRSSVSH